MITLKFKVKEQKLKRIDKLPIVNKSRNTISCQFEFLDSENWENVEKFAIFSNKHDTFLCSLGKDMDCECIIPEEAMCGREMKVGVYGGDRLTTNTITIHFFKSNYTTRIRPSKAKADFFQEVLKRVGEKYDDLEIQEDKIYCYGDGEIKKIISLDNLVLNNYYTRSYIDEKLAAKYDDFSYSDGYIDCYGNGELLKRVPISAIVEEYYTKKEIDERLDEINKDLNTCVVDGEIDSTKSGVYIILKTLNEE